MYLYVEMIDMWESYQNCINLGEATPVHKRIVKVKLTEDQIKLLKPLQVGTGSYNAPMYEEYKLLCLQED